MGSDSNKAGQVPLRGSMECNGQEPPGPGRALEATPLGTSLMGFFSSAGAEQGRGVTGQKNNAKKKRLRSQASSPVAIESVQAAGSCFLPAGDPHEMPSLGAGPAHPLISPSTVCDTSGRAFSLPKCQLAVRGGARRVVVARAEPRERDRAFGV